MDTLTEIIKNVRHRYGKSGDPELLLLLDYFEMILGFDEEGVEKHFQFHVRIQEKLVKNIKEIDSLRAKLKKTP
jgi:hypothetical protein